MLPRSLLGGSPEKGPGKTVSTLGKAWAMGTRLDEVRRLLTLGLRSLRTLSLALWYGPFRNLVRLRLDRDRRRTFNRSGSPSSFSLSRYDFQIQRSHTQRCQTGDADRDCCANHDGRYRFPVSLAQAVDYHRRVCQCVKIESAGRDHGLRWDTFRVLWYFAQKLTDQYTLAD